MKFKLLTTTALFTILTIQAQFGPQQIISTNIDAAFRAIPFDLNLDGNIDVIAGSDDKIAWYQNIDGLGTFSTEQIINNNIPAIFSLDIFDLDSDGDMDILYSTGLDKIAWLENLDGYGNFGQEQIIADIDHPYNINAADIDGDGDMDVFAVLYHNGFYNRLVWYENLDGLGNFSSEKLIELNEFYISTLLNFDLDNDGDMDLITSYESGNPSQIIWYENIDGLGNFSAAQEIYQFNYFSDWVSIYNFSHTDVNNDGKIDLLVETNHDFFPNTLLWLENLGEGSFEPPVEISVLETTLGSIRSYDLDSDGDNDLLLSYYYQNNFTSISWFENLDGLGQFSTKKIISTDVIRALDATAADIDGDGDIDVVSASKWDSKIAWYENTGILELEINNHTLFNIYPNPTNGMLTVTSLSQIAFIKVYDALGSLVLTARNSLKIDLTGLSSGVYMIKIETSDNESQIRKVIKI